MVLWLLSSEDQESISFLQKPFTSNDLLIKVKQIMEITAKLVLLT